MITKKNKFIATLATSALLLNSIGGINPVKAADNLPKVSYRTHIQSIGWQDYKTNGELSGTEGKSLRLEGIKIKVEGDENLGIKYSTHVQNIGWQDWKTNDDAAGTEGQAKRLEAIKIELTGSDAENYDIYYRVHSQNFGWLGWAKNGAEAGTEGYGYRLEGIEIKIVEKGAEAPGTTDNCFKVKPMSVSYRTHVQSIGWQSYVSDGKMAGTSGQSKRLEAINIKLTNQKLKGDIEYSTHIQNIGWQGFVKNNALSGTSGQSKRLEAIKIRLTDELAENYDIYYRVHAQNFGWLGWAKNGESAGTEGYGYRLEGIEIKLVEKGAEAPGSTDNSFKKNTSIDDMSSENESVYLNKATYYEYDYDESGTKEANKIVLEFSENIKVKDASMIKLYDKGDAYDCDIDYPTNFTFDDKQFVSSITSDGNKLICELTEEGPEDHYYASGEITMNRIKHKDNIRIKISKSTDKSTALTDEKGNDITIKNDEKVGINVINKSPNNETWVVSYDSDGFAENQLEVGFGKPLNLDTVKIDYFKVYKVDENNNPIYDKEVPIKELRIGYVNQNVILTLDENSENYNTSDKYVVAMKDIEDVYGNSFTTSDMYYKHISHHPMWSEDNKWFLGQDHYNCFKLYSGKKATGKEISSAYYEDYDENNNVNEGDKILIVFFDGIVAPDKISIDNFEFSSDCDLGTGYKIDRGEFNNDLIITLGKGAKLNHGTSTINISCDESKVSLYGNNKLKFKPSENAIIIK